MNWGRKKNEATIDRCGVQKKRSSFTGENPNSGLHQRVPLQGAHWWILRVKQEQDLPITPHKVWTAWQCPVRGNWHNSLHRIRALVEVSLTFGLFFISKLVVTVEVNTIRWFTRIMSLLWALKPWYSSFLSSKESGGNNMKMASYTLLKLLPLKAWMTLKSLSLVFTSLLDILVRIPVKAYVFLRERLNYKIMYGEVWARLK